ncbi:hypothetical protein LZ30DRAFT_698991 [Colletotrichum cereale]|nr:hypothetical protein LZ30DRAFT_698991 [Colletotrichum cereale]
MRVGLQSSRVMILGILVSIPCHAICLVYSFDHICFFPRSCEKLDQEVNGMKQLRLQTWRGDGVERGEPRGSVTWASTQLDSPIFIFAQRPHDQPPRNPVTVSWVRSPSLSAATFPTPFLSRFTQIRVRRRGVCIQRTHNMRLCECVSVHTYAALPQVDRRSCPFWVESMNAQTFPTASSLQPRGISNRLGCRLWPAFPPPPAFH